MEPRSNIGRIPQRQVLLATSAADLTRNHHARMNPHPYGQAEPFVLFQASIQGAERLDHAQPGPHRPLRIILVGLRIAKVDQQSIAEILGNYPSKRWMTSAQVV